MEKSESPHLGKRGRKIMTKFLKGTWVAAALLLVFANPALGINVKRVFQDYKFPTQKSTEMQTFTNPHSADTHIVADGLDGNTSAAAATITLGITNPDVPRVLSIGAKASSVDIGTCALVVNGTNINNGTISETLNFANNEAASLVTQNAFKTVTSLVFPANCEDGAFGTTWNIGTGESLGVARCMDNSGDFLFSLLNGSKEATAPSLAVHASQVGKNTVDFNGSMNSSNDFILYYFQNFSCSP